MADNKNNYSEAAVSMLKANLGFFGGKIPDDLDAYLLSLLGKAYADFLEMGVQLSPGLLADDFDQATYAAWLYRNAAVGSGKTEMLKSMIRNRQVGNALKETSV